MCRRTDARFLKSYYKVLVLWQSITQTYSEKEWEKHNRVGCAEPISHHFPNLSPRPTTQFDLFPLSTQPAMANHFQALLSNFQCGTGDSVNQKDGTSNKNKSLKELTTSLWQRTQLRQSVKLLTTSNQCNVDVVTKETNPIHLAICLCIVDSLTHVSIWEEWVREKSDSPVSANLYVHAKFPEKITHPWARSKLISITHRPNWNDVRIVQAMLSLIEEALKDETTTHIVFGTESCLPICPLDQVHMEHGKSYASYYGKNQATRFDERDVWDVLQPHIPLDAIHKALPGWCTLARNHAKQILDMPKKELQGTELWPVFESCWAPEEAFFPTVLALLGLLSETECKSLTYASWTSGRPKKPEDKAHPKCWDREFDAKLVAKLRSTDDCIILRKLKYPMQLDHWRQAVLRRALPTKRLTESEEPNIGPNKRSKM